MRCCYCYCCCCICIAGSYFASNSCVYSQTTVLQVCQSDKIPCWSAQDHEVDATATGLVRLLQSLHAASDLSTDAWCCRRILFSNLFTLAVCFKSLHFRRRCASPFKELTDCVGLYLVEIGDDQSKNNWPFNATLRFARTHPCSHFVSTSSSAMTERPRDTCFTSIRKIW